MGVSAEGVSAWGVSARGGGGGVVCVCPEGGVSATVHAGIHPSPCEQNHRHL